MFPRLGDYELLPSSLLFSSHILCVRLPGLACKLLPGSFELKAMSDDWNGYTGIPILLLIWLSGSGKLGETRMLRCYGPSWATICLFVSVLKLSRSWPSLLVPVSPLFKSSEKRGDGWLKSVLLA